MRHMVGLMRVYLEPWVVQDGHVPELRAGEVLRDVGVAAACWSCDRSHRFDLCQEAPGEDPDGSSTAHSLLDGALIWRAGDRVGVLRVHDMLFVVEGIVERVALETFRRSLLDLPAVGQRMRVHAGLYVMPAHEVDLDPDGESSPPGVVRDWLVHAVQFERRGRRCEVVSVETLDRMQAWDEEDSGGEYLLELSPM
jgi:hypothetical protein